MPDLTVRMPDPVSFAQHADDPAEDASARVSRLRLQNGFHERAIARAMLDELGVTGLAAGVLLPLITDRVHHILRDQARQEHEVHAREERQQQIRDRRDRAARTGGVRLRSQLAPEVPSGSLAFLDCKIIMSGAPLGYKLYRHLTVAEHEARRLVFEKNGHSILHTARSHQWSVRECQQHNVNGLDEIPEQLLASELPEEGIRP